MVIAFHQSTISWNTDVPPDNMILAYKFADVDVTLREPQQTSIVDSAGFLGREEQYFRETDAFGAGST